MATKTIDPTLYERAASLGLDLLPSTPTIGAEVSGLDLDGPLNVTQAEWLHDAWIAHKVLFFRHQDISYESHVRLGRLFGELEGHPVITHVEGYPEILRIEGVEGVQLSADTPDTFQAYNKWQIGKASCRERGWR